MRVGFHTFGCKLNQFETEALAEPFQSRGFSIVTAREEAELYIINTCTVTGRADHKARALVRSLCRRRPGSVIVVTGCAAQAGEEGLSALGANVVVIPQARKASLLELPGRLAAAGSQTAGSALEAIAVIAAAESETGRNEPAGGMPPVPGAFSFHAGRLSFHTRAFLKIQDGCDCSCAYCTVPLARGPSQSLDAVRVLERAAELERLGFREVVLTGVNISAYAWGGAGLSGLLGRLLAGTSFTRFRLSSLEPEAIDPGLSDVLVHPRICAHFHIPVQSGSDAVLRRMRRRYESERVIDAVSILRRVKDDPFLAADIIVGFPGESAEDFRRTRDIVLAARFSALHVFPFSPRPGTAAVSYTGHIPQRVRDDRAAELGALSRELSREYQARWVGKVVDVLLQRETPKNPGAATGVSSNYLKVVVEGLPPDRRAGGAIANVRILAFDPAARSAAALRGAFIDFAV